MLADYPSLVTRKWAPVIPVYCVQPYAPHVLEPLVWDSRSALHIAGKHSVSFSGGYEGDRLHFKGRKLLGSQVSHLPLTDTVPKEILRMPVVSMPRHFGTEVELVNAQVEWTFPIIFSMTNSSMICSCFLQRCQDDSFCFFSFLPGVKLRIFGCGIWFASLGCDKTAGGVWRKRRSSMIGRLVGKKSSSHV